MKSSRISISRSKGGTTIRATGSAANALFNAMAAEVRRPAAQITAGSRVEFDSEHGPQRGTVIGVQGDHAVVEVDHALSGCTWNMPLKDLQLEAVAA